MSGGDLITIEEEPVGDVINTKTVIPKEEWFHSFLASELSPLCCFCLAEPVDHMYGSTHPVCSSCFKYFKNKPSIIGKKMFIKAINSVRQVNDIVTDLDLTIFESVQDIIEESDWEEHSIFLKVL